MKILTMDLRKYKFKKKVWGERPFSRKYLSKNRLVKCVKGRYGKDFDLIFPTEVEEKMKKDFSFKPSINPALPIGTDMINCLKCVVVRDGRKIIARGKL